MTGLQRIMLYSSVFVVWIFTASHYGEWINISIAYWVEHGPVDAPDQFLSAPAMLAVLGLASIIFLPGLLIAELLKWMKSKSNVSAMKFAMQTVGVLGVMVFASGVALGIQAIW